MPGFSNVSVKPMLTPATRGVLWALFATFNFALMGVLTKESARLFAYQSNELATWRNLAASVFPPNCCARMWCAVSPAQARASSSSIR